MTIFGISIGTSRTGVCILQDGKLIEMHVHDYPALWSDKKLKKILNRYRQYLKRYPVTDVIVKIPSKSGLSKEVRRLMRRTEALAKEYYCTFDLTTKIEIKGTLLLRSTDEMVRFAREAYPQQLAALYSKGVATNHSYHRKLYEAVLAAHIYEERQRVRKLQKENT
ncbi:hypothetical protein ACFGVS_19120 [Mucilaginibacter sp. AW1-7]|uniref:hypothetical protein n=1 Tax=Mucilaginibacter sp. AW1-7 TaxID=3349874 RepID=UPI003F73D792